MRLCVFDIDGTLIRSYLREGGPPESYDLVELLPDSREKLQRLHAEGVRLATASNQGGVAFGKQTLEQTEAKMRAVVEALGVPITPNWSCEHPKATRPEWKADTGRRKPGPRMIVEAMGLASALPHETTMVGDRPEDEGAAAAAGVRFEWAWDFFAGREAPE